MKKIYNLSLTLDKDGKNRIDLASFSNLEELDDFIMSNFTTTEDVRTKYKEVIDIFFQKNADFFKKIKRKYRGSVVITYDDGNKVRRIPVMYKDGRRLKDLEECLNIFEESYLNKEIIREIKKYKPDIFTGEEIGRLNRARYFLYYQQYSADDMKEFGAFARMFRKRILNTETLYYHFRYMMDYFDFSIGENKTNVMVTEVKTDKLSDIEKSKIYHSLYHGNGEIVKFSEIKTPEREGIEVVDNAPEEFKYAFYKALDTGDFDILYNLYSIEEIEKYTRGKRK